MQSPVKHGCRRQPSNLGTVNGSCCIQQYPASPAPNRSFKPTSSKEGEEATEPKPEEEEARRSFADGRKRVAVAARNCLQPQSAKEKIELTEEEKAKWSAPENSV